MKNNSTQSFFTDTHTCYICKKKYSNKCLGKLECYEHTGYIKNGVFTCCAVDACIGNETISLTEYFKSDTNAFPPHIQGCIRSDHKSISENNVYIPYSNPLSYTESNVEISKKLASKLNLNINNAKESSDSSFHYSICRYDEEGYKKNKKKIYK
jgi:hypothetical protein